MDTETTGKDTWVRMLCCLCTFWLWEKNVSHIVLLCVGFFFVRTLFCQVSMRIKHVCVHCWFLICCVINHNKNRFFSVHVEGLRDPVVITWWYTIRNWGWRSWVQAGLLSNGPYCYGCCHLSVYFCLCDCVWVSLWPLLALICARWGSSWSNCHYQVIYDS